MSEFKTITLGLIAPDPNQPRKFYDPAAMQELVASVKEKGVIQPILIRPNAHGDGNVPYILVCGERRYRASTEAGLLEIPAVIRELTDEEALELQIIENLQRKDVHPMEEAVAFKSLLENKNVKHTVEEIAARVGKSPFYVRQRLKFNALTADWQELFYSGKMHNVDAAKVALLPDADQKKLFTAQVPKDYKKRADFFLDVDDWVFRDLRRDLLKASFDPKDETLNPKMGACTGCGFNSAVASLFPDDAKSPVCSNGSCYQEKSDKAFKTRLEEALHDPAVIIVRVGGYWISPSDIQKLEKLAKGNKIYQEHSTCRIIDSPSKTAIETGKIVKAFVIDGNGKGQYTWAEIVKQNSSAKGRGAAKPADKIKEGKASVEDVDSEITRIQDREKRAKEIDLEKVHKAILEKLDKHDVVTSPVLPWQGANDRAIMVFLLLESCNYGAKNKIKAKLKGITVETSYGKHGYNLEHFEKLGKVTDDQLAFIIRLIAHEKRGSVNVQSVHTGDTTMRLIAEYAGIDIASIEASQMEVATKRMAKVAARIEQLKKVKADLKPAVAKKAATKKAAPKKAAPKKSAKKKAAVA
jgi:ParB family chromosome partitioning protein